MPAVSAAHAAARALPILVMGDSYSAGNGAGDYFGAKGCWRSDNDYAGVFAHALQGPPHEQPTVLDNTACSGDTSAAFSRFTHGRRPQLDALNKGYGIIFLTVGGDDIDFAQIVQNCLIQITRDGQKCSALLSQADNLLKDGELQTRISSVLDAIHAKANSHAKIVLLGYPYIEGKENYRLPYGHNKSIDVPTRLRAIGAFGDQVQEDAVGKLDAKYHTSNFVFVKTKSLFAEHELLALSLNPDRWFVAPETDAGLAWRAWWYHPNPTGWAEEAGLLLRDSAVPKTNPIPAPRPIRHGGAGALTLDGHVGPLRLRHSTRTDVVSFAGEPDYEQTDTTYQVEDLGYDCALVSNYESCQTTFYLGLTSGKLVEFMTRSKQYAALERIRIGMPTGTANRLAHRRAIGGCRSAISLFNPKFQLTIDIGGGRDQKPTNPSSPLVVVGGHVDELILNSDAGALDCA